MYGILKEFDNEKLPNQRFYFYRSLKWNDDLEMRSMTAEIEGIMYLSGKNKEEQPVRKPKVQKPKIFFSSVLADNPPLSDFFYSGQ